MENVELDLIAKNAVMKMSKLLAEGQLPRGDYIELASLIQLYLTPLKRKTMIQHLYKSSRCMGQSINYLKLKILGTIQIFKLKLAY